MTNKEFYNWLLSIDNLTLTLRWYNDFGSVDVADFTKDRKFQEVHISKVDADAAYDIAYNDMSLFYLLDEDFEEIVHQMVEIQTKYFRNRGWKTYMPIVQNVLVQPKGMAWGETYFIA